MKTRSVIIVLGTLILGFVLGILTSGQIRYHRMKPMRVFFSEERFREGFYKIIQPDNEEQKAQIDQILRKYAKINSNLQSEYRKDIEASMREFRKEIDSRLTREQIARLREMEEKRQQMIRENRRNRENDTTGRRNDGRFDDGRHRDRPSYHGRDSVPPPPPSTDNK